MLHSWIDNYNLLLGSGSPRRAQLLTEMNLNFTKVSIDIKEVYDEKMDVAAVAEYLAKLKSQGYEHALSDRDWLITADSVVIVDGIIYGKPKDNDEALEYLLKMSGGHHQVMTGVCLRSQSHTYSFSSTSKVQCALYSKEEAQLYIRNFKPFDKAGAYGIQEWFGHCLIEKIDGSFTNIMGLPTQALYKALSHFKDMHNHSPR